MSPVLYQDLRSQPPVFGGGKVPVRLPPGLRTGDYLPGHDRADNCAYCIGVRGL